MVDSLELVQLRDPDLAAEFITAGLALSCAVAPSKEQMGRALEWSLQIASNGEPLPPVGFVSDVGHIALSLDRGSAPRNPQVEGVDWRKYGDYVLGKLAGAGEFQAAIDALKRYQEGREKIRGVTFVINQFRQRAGVEGALVSPSVIRNLQRKNLDELLAAGETILAQGMPPLLVDLYRQLIQAVRNTGEVLGGDDVFELKRGTALAEFGDRVALRQILQAAEQFQAALPLRKPRSAVRRYQTATHILEEDIYPIGGYSSLSNKGSIESLLYSQLSYMEPPDVPGARPDLFDVKFLRDELLYYSRDENQFLRRRRSFVAALQPDLVAARFKDPEAPYQRIVLTMAALVTMVRKLIEWLSDDALRFEILFLDRDVAPPDAQGGAGPKKRRSRRDAIRWLKLAHRRTAGGPNRGGASGALRLADGGQANLLEEAPLIAEQSLLETLLAEQIANQTVSVERLPPSFFARRCEEHARRSLCHSLLVTSTPAEKDRFHVESSVVPARLQVDQPRPALGMLDPPPAFPEPEDQPPEIMEAWRAVLDQLLRAWI